MNARRLATSQSRPATAMASRQLRLPGTAVPSPCHGVSPAYIIDSTLCDMDTLSLRAAGLRWLRRLHGRDPRIAPARMPVNAGPARPTYVAELSSVADLRLAHTRQHRQRIRLWSAREGVA